MYKEAGFKWRHDLLPKYVQSKQGGSFLVSRELIINSDFYKWTTVELEGREPNGTSGSGAHD